ncbi:lysophospholipid acyltransferase family protein [Butyrivibrio sp. VCB2001]|uniref:lysophospholipid acyltransferase family protein n=1 Tax=Butyrivibrio sp. VCB2001 TaxID=1280667 RepID=UPI0004094B11|nr:lysophospholipid acyltransferase family protein [Butyrivibrio sp. VCB2001]
MIRTIIIFIFLVIFLIVSLPMQLVLFIMHKFNDDKARKASLAIVSWAFNVILFLGGIKRIVIGEDNVPKDEAVLYVSNHRSIFDIVVTYPRVPRRTGYIAKQESMKLPVISFWMVYLDCLFLDRSDIRKGLEMVLTAIDKVKNGISIFIYPEGTRNKTDKPLGEFHKGSFKIAQKSGCPIVPVVVNHTRDCFENHMPWIKKTTVVIEYCEPIRIKELEKEDQKNIDQYVKNIIEQTYIKNENLEI